MSPPGARLAAEGLVFDYPGPRRAIDGIDVGLSPGELVVLCGPNGAGKSTLLALLSGLLRPTAGSVTFDGRPLERLPPRARGRALARVPQSLRTLPELRVRAFVLAGRYARISTWRGPRPEDWQAVDRALAETDASDLRERGLDELSGGQRQRVILARALASEAELLLVDEPTAALDPEHQVTVFARLRDLSRGGRGVLVASHDLNLASQFATRLLLLSRGRVAAAGLPRDVLRAEVLAPVYGTHLHYGTLDGRPFVLPWLHGGAPDKGARP